MAGEFTSVLIANRGEIAVRVIRAARDAGLRSIAVFADTDAAAPHVRLADESYSLHGQTAAETYLDADKVLDVALASGAEAVHPGYGFLSENADFAQAVIKAGLVWIGPSPDSIRALGDKVTARQIAQKVGAPLVPGSDGVVNSAEEATVFAAEYGLPIAIKASFGGGGRGLRVARTVEEIAEQFDAATREAVAAFGRGECFVERYLDRPRHVEAQVLADHHGSVIVVGTRDCTLQRRHQKLVEEAPAPFLSEQQEESIYSSAKAIVREVGYIGAGTVEFLVGQDGVISFLEVNTRLQVEHTVTEETTGIDLVLEQFRIARGEPMGPTVDPTPTGHSFEFRINSEDPSRNFLPSPGTIRRWSLPEGPGIRVDSGVEQGTEVGQLFDSMLAKLVVTGKDRATALARSRRALDEAVVEGMPTVLPFDRAVVRDPAFTASDGKFAVHTGWIEEQIDSLLPAVEAEHEADSDVVTVTIGGRHHRVALPGLSTLGDRAAEIRTQAAESEGLGSASTTHGDTVTSPMQGTVIKVAVEEGQQVEVGDVLLVVEAMKMENPVVAHQAGVIEDLQVAVGDTRAQGDLLCRISASAADSAE